MLSTKMTIAAVGLVLGTALTIALVARRGIREGVVPVEINRLQMATDRYAAKLDAYVRGSTVDVAAVAETPPLAGYVRAVEAGGVDPVTGLTAQAWRAQIADTLSAHLRAKKSYLQFRFIGAADGGREIVRVERTAANESNVTVVAEGNLQRKGQRSYYLNAIALQPGDIYVSPIELNREHGAIQEPQIPVLRAATVVPGGDGSPFGVLVINIDVGPVLDISEPSVFKSEKWYVINEDGQYLRHADDPDRAFAFDYGKSEDWAVDFPELAEAQRVAVRGMALLRRDTGQRIGAAVSSTRLAGTRLVTILATANTADLAASASHVFPSAYQGAVPAVLAAILVAVLLTRSLSRPLETMAVGVEAFPDQKLPELPVKASGEIGVLARAFVRMAEDVEARTEELVNEIGERKLAQQLLAEKAAAHQQAEERFESLVEACPPGICLIGQGGEVKLVNAAMERLVGYTRSELLGKLVEDLMPERFRTGHVSLREGFQHDPIMRPMGSGEELFILTRNGNEIPVEIGLAPVTTDDGPCVLCTVVDISERKDAAARLSLYAEELKRSNDELERFAFVVSHDLKAPLRGIASVAAWISEDFQEKVDDDARENLQLMRERTTALDRLIDGILEYSRVGRQKLSCRVLNVNALVRDVIDSLRAPQSIEITIEGDLPDVVYDQTQLRQVFQNLIQNAVAHLGKPQGRISVSAEKDSGMYRFAVRDDGVGIDPDRLTEVFHLFERGAGHASGGSAGLGLSIVKRIVERNGGTVDIRSEPGKGTEVKFTVPDDVVVAESDGRESVSSAPKDT